MSREGEKPGPLGRPRPVREDAESREAMLRRGIGVFRDFASSAQGADRSQALVMQYFLQSVRKDTNRPLSDVITVLYQKLDLKGVSEEFRRLVSQTISEVAAVFGHAGDRIVLPPAPDEPFEDVSEPVTASEITPPHGIAAVPAKQSEGMAGDRISFDPLGALFSSHEDYAGEKAEMERAQRERAHELKRRHFARAFATAREFAGRFIARANPERVDAQYFAQRIEETTRTLDDIESELYETFGFSATSIRNTPTEGFFSEYFDALDRAGEHAAEFDQKVHDYIGVRARVGALLAREAAAMRGGPRITPEEILGVHSDAPEEKIEREYLLRLQVLNPDFPEDQASIAMLHEARQRLLQRRRFSRGEARNPQIPPTEESEGIMMRTLRAPGKLLRTLFGIAALGTAAGIAVHEFAENDSDESKIADVAPVGENIEGVGNRQSIGPSKLAERVGNVDGVSGEAHSGKNEKPESNKVVLERGDSVWKIVISMLRERGLPTSNALVQYFTHQALVDNGWTALSALEKKPGEKLDVTNIARMMDAMVGERGVSEVMVAPPAKAPVTPEKLSTLSGAEETSNSWRDGSEHSDDVLPNLVVSTPQPENMSSPIAEAKPYSELPSIDRAEHVMVKGESVYKLVHQMLRSRGLNWTTERINFLTQLVVDKNADRFREMVADGRMRKMDDVWIPAGAMLDFSDAVAVVDEMERAKNAGKKAKTVKELAKDRGYKYPIMMKFPKE